jgi:hypothetical protein
MKATRLLHDLGQGIWLNNITRELLESGTLERYIDELSVTALTSNAIIFDHAIKNSSVYDSAIRDELAKGKSGEALFFDLAPADITRAADLFRAIRAGVGAEWHRESRRPIGWNWRIRQVPLRVAQYGVPVRVKNRNPKRALYPKCSPHKTEESLARY